MREHPQTYSTDSVRKILARTKTATRRIVKPQPIRVDKPTVLPDLPVRVTFGPGWWHRDVATADSSSDPGFAENLRGHAPYAVGDRIWVRELWRPYVVHSHADNACDCGDIMIDYPADDAKRFFSDDFMVDKAKAHDWTIPKAAKSGNVTPMYMPRWASRIFLRVTSVGVERVQSISVEDIVAEGIVVPPCAYDKVPERPDVLDFERACWARREFGKAWDAINGRRGSWQSNPWVWVFGFELDEVLREPTYDERAPVEDGAWT